MSNQTEEGFNSLLQMHRSCLNMIRADEEKLRQEKKQRLDDINLLKRLAHKEGIELR